MPPKQKVVVIGGGAAGASIVRQLSKKLDPSTQELILITARPRFAYIPASLRLLVSRDASTEIVFMPYDTVFDKFPGQLKIAHVESIEETQVSGEKGGKVILKDGEVVPYDIVIVATGSAWEGLVAFPDEENLYKEHIDLWQNKFERAQNVVIVGGGAVGIELAGEIKDIYPNKPVTIIQKDKYLLSDIYPRKFRVDLERRLRLRGVDIIFDDSIEGQPRVDATESTVNTKKGTALKCDLLVTARGAGPNTSLLKSLSKSPLTDRGYVKVAPTLQVLEHPSIFAAGDIIDVPGAKQFQKTAAHAAVAAENTLSYLRGDAPKATCSPGKEIIVVSNGRNGGAGYIGILWGIQFGDFISRVAKSQDLLVGYVRKNLGLPVKIKE